MYATGQTRSSLSMVEEVLNGVNSTEMEKLESDVEEIFNCTINSSSVKMDNPSRIIDPPGESSAVTFILWSFRLDLRIVHFRPDLEQCIRKSSKIDIFSEFLGNVNF